MSDWDEDDDDRTPEAIPRFPTLYLLPVVTWTVTGTLGSVFLLSVLIHFLDRSEFGDLIVCSGAIYCLLFASTASLMISGIGLIFGFRAPIHFAKAVSFIAGVISAVIGCCTIMKPWISGIAFPLGSALIYSAVILEGNRRKWNDWVNYRSMKKMKNDAWWMK